MSLEPVRFGSGSYGVMCADFGATQSFEYMTVVRVESFDAAAADQGRTRVKPQRYAVGRGGIEIWCAVAERT